MDSRDTELTRDDFCSVCGVELKYHCNYLACCPSCGHSDIRYIDGEGTYCYNCGIGGRMPWNRRYRTEAERKLEKMISENKMLKMQIAILEAVRTA